MNSIATIRYPQQFTSTALMALCIGSACAETPVQQVQPAKHTDYKYEHLVTSSTSVSVTGLKLVQPSSFNFAAEISAFYADFAASQEDLGSEFEAALMANLSSLYED